MAMPSSPPAPARPPRTPLFLAGVRATLGHAAFGVSGLGAGGGPRVVSLFDRDGTGNEAPSTETSAMEPPPNMEPLAPPLPPPPPTPGPEFVARLARAVADLRRTGERLGEQASAD